MKFYASKCHDTLNGSLFNIETITDRLCLNPYYKVTLCKNVAYMLDSGAFQDVGKESRLSYSDALQRQFKFERDVGICAESFVSYDRLVDEQVENGKQIKKRVLEKDGLEYVEDTIRAAEYINTQRDRIGARKLILSNQGVTSEQYIGCVESTLPLCTNNDIVGLGGFCVMYRSKEYEKMFFKVIKDVFPKISESSTKRVHIFGMSIFRVLMQTEMLAKKYGLEVSYDTSSAEVNATMGRMFDPMSMRLVGVFSKEQKYNGYRPPSIAKMNINLINYFWDQCDLLEIPSDDFDISTSDIPEQKNRTIFEF